jgi:hypothetical protein
LSFKTYWQNASEIGFFTVLHDKLTWHVKWLSCEDVTVLTEELNERAFLYAIDVRTHGDLLAGVVGNEVDLASEHGRFE